MESFSVEFHQLFGRFIDKVCCNEYRYPEDVALALDDLALMAWGEVRSLYPNSILLEESVIDNTNSVFNS